MMNKLDMQSENIIGDNIEYIREKFPNVVIESDKGYAIDFNALKQELSDVIVDETKEKYQLTWPGKKESIVTTNTPTTNTLRPVKEKSVNFDTTENIYIEGDNLEALKILQESYLGKIKCIYIDPPYNTGNDFIYKDNFNKDANQELIESGQIDEAGNKLVTNNYSNGRFHSDWLSMMYPRLKLARNLLTETGICYISIDEHEIKNILCLITEIFGDNNYEILVWRKNGKQGNTKVINRFKNSHEYIIVAYKNKMKTSLTKMRLKPNWRTTSNPDNDPRGDWMSGNISKEEEKSRVDSPNYYSIITPTGKKIEREWFISKDEFNKLKNDILINNEGKKVSRIFFPNNGDGIPRIKRFKDEEQEFYFDSIIDEMGNFTDARNDLITLFDGKDLFSTPKPVKMLEELIRISTGHADIIMDFFSGSASFAHAMLQLNSDDNGKRKYIMMQLPEECKVDTEAYKSGYKTICDIGEERIRRAAKKIKEETNADIDYGFRVYKIDSSNMKDVYYKPSELNQEQLELFETNIKDDRTPEDLLTQVILDLGLTLDLKIEEKNIFGNKVYFVDSNSLVACFDDDLNINIIDEICKYKPLKVVFKDNSFENDNDKINVEEKIKKLSPETELNIL